jgi:hypothetical protein
MKNAAEKRAYDRDWARTRYATDPEYRATVLARNAKNRAKNLDKYLDTQRRNNWRKNGAEPTRPMPELCELCGGKPNGYRNRVLFLDHDHLTGAFRGWLCNNCNMAIGLLKDNPELCEKVAQYLRRPQCN